eukprot:1148256-Pelagomonas_calceolata.AAC.1
MNSFQRLWCRKVDQSSAKPECLPLPYPIPYPASSPDLAYAAHGQALLLVTAARASFCSLTLAMCA